MSLSKIPKSNFAKKGRLTKENLEEIVNNSGDSKFSDDSSQSHVTDMSPENICRPISSESEEDYCSNDEVDSTAHGQKQEKGGLILVEDN